VTIDSALNTLTVSAAFANLLAPTTAAHIHCCTVPPGTAIVATVTPAFPGFPFGVFSRLKAPQDNSTMFGVIRRENAFFRPKRSRNQPKGIEVCRQ
jgi:hypothetical protein